MLHKYMNKNILRILFFLKINFWLLSINDAFYTVMQSVQSSPAKFYSHAIGALILAKI